MSLFRISKMVRHLDRATVLRIHPSNHHSKFLHGRHCTRYSGYNRSKTWHPLSGAARLQRDLLVISKCVKSSRYCAEWGMMHPGEWLISLGSREWEGE